MRYTIQSLQKQFPTDNECLDFIFKRRFPNLTGYKRVKNRLCYQNAKGHQIYPLKGTMYERTRVPLTLWFYALYLFSHAKNGVSAKELQRQLGVSYETAWRMGVKIRSAMKQQHTLEGVVEVDETYVGGRSKRHGGRSTKKTPVMGLTSRTGQAVLKVIPNVRGTTLTQTILDNVNTDATIISDDWIAYKWVKRTYNHYIINHSEGHMGYENTYGLKVNTNRVEGLWNHVKSTIRGTYMGVSKAYLQTYLDMIAFQYNHRNSDVPLFQILLQRSVA